MIYIYIYIYIYIWEREREREREREIDILDKNRCLIYFNCMSTCRIILCQEVKELHSLYAHIDIFMLLFLNGPPNQQSYSILTIFYTDLFDPYLRP